MKIVSSSEELLRKASELSGVGWDVIRIDEPDRATVGYMGFRGEPDNEEVLHLVWPFLGATLEPTFEEVGPDQYVEALRVDNAIAVDYPKQLKLGVAIYDPDNGTAKILTIRITQFKELPRETREFINERRISLRNAWNARLPHLPYDRVPSS